MGYSDVVSKRLAQHVYAFWDSNEKQGFSWQLGRINTVLPNFSVIRVAPANDEEPWVYLTHGAWEVDIEKSYRLEFVLLTPQETPRHVETLAMLATYHAERHLDVGKTLAIGRGWLESASCDHFLVSLPYSLGPRLEKCQVDSELLVRYLWLLPITADEAEFARQSGHEALERKFEEQEIDAIDPNRASVV